MAEQTEAIPTASGICTCPRCEGRTHEIYRMIGRCNNCKTTPILMLFRRGDHVQTLDCPACGVTAVHAERRVTDDEIPAAAEPVSDDAPRSEP
jgi:hypothetical protein